MSGPVARRKVLALGAGLAAGLVGRELRPAWSMPPPEYMVRPEDVAAPTSGVLPVPVIGRAAWGAKRARHGLVAHRPVRLTLHHSGVLLTDHAEAPAHVRQHQAWHLQIGHPDIDYHYLVDRRGHIYRGRDDRFRGDTQTEYDPTGHFLVCCEGDYHKAQRPTGAQLRSVARIFAYAVHRWQIDPETVRGHRDYARTTCPGSALYAHLRDGSLADRVARIAASYDDVTAAVMAKPAGRALVQRIEAGR